MGRELVEAGRRFDYDADVTVKEKSKERLDTGVLDCDTFLKEQQG